MAKFFLRWKEIQFRWSDGYPKYWQAKKFPAENYSTRHSGGGSLMIWQTFSSSRKFKLQFVSGQQKAADYVKMLNDLSLTQEGHHLCGEEWIFQQDNAAIHNESITKKYLFEQKLSSWPPSIFSRHQSDRKSVDWLVGLFLWHINLCRLFNAKSIFM